MTKTKISIGVIAVTVLTVATLFLFPMPMKTAVKTAVATRGSLVDTLLLEGMVVYEGQTPLVSLQPGVIEHVFVKQGERVEEGQLLFLMDSTEEQTALAMISTEKNRMDSVEGEWRNLLFSQRSELLREETALRRSIAMKQIRAEKDGIMGVVCCRTGESISEGTVLGSLHGEEIRVEAFLPVEEAELLAPESEAFLLDSEGEIKGRAVLERIGTLETDPQTGAMGCRVWFVPMQPMTIGRRLTLEVSSKAQEDLVLVPVQAVDLQGRIWVIEDGKVEPERVSFEGESDGYTALPEYMEGKTVIMNPDEYDLVPGDSIKMEGL